MNNLKKLLDTPVGVKSVPVEFEIDGKKQKIEMVGMPDSMYLTLLQMPDEKKALRAKAFTNELQARHADQKVTPVKPEDVYNILLVHHFLPDSLEMTDNDVAILSMEQGLVFGALLGGAMKIIGNTDKDQTLTPEQMAGLGN